MLIFCAKAVQTMADFLKVSISGNVDAMLEHLTQELQENVARAGAQAMAQIVYDAARQNAPVGTVTRRFKSGREIKPGALKAAIYQVFSEDRSNNGVKTYHVGWNRKKAPHGHLIEFGTSRMPARPFLYPAFEQNKAQLVNAASTKMAEKLKEIK